MSDIPRKRTAAELQELLAAPPFDDSEAIAELDAIGDRIGYGRLEQIAAALFRLQCHRRPLAGEKQEER